MSKNQFSKLLHRYLRLRDQQQSIQEELAEIHAELKGSAEPGHKNGITVYQVRESRVKAHTRSAYTAMRVNGGHHEQ